MNFSFFLAKRYLKSRKSQGFFSVMTLFSFLGIMLGVATLICVMSVMNGFRLNLRDQILGFNGHISLHSRIQEPLANSKELLDYLETHKSVASYAPVVDRHIMVMANNDTRVGMLRGIQLEDLEKKHLISQNIKEGGIESLKAEEIGIGQRLAERLRVRVGDLVTIISPEGVAGMFGVVPRMASFNVGFIFETGAKEYDSAAIVMSLSLAQKFFRLKDSVSIIEIFMKNADEASPFAQELRKTWNGQYQVMDWQAANTGLMSLLILERNVMFFIVGLIIVIASFNIITSLVMLVQQKSKDIAILRTIGATRRQIMQAFFFCGAILGIMGTSLGVLLGTLLAANLDAIRRFAETLLGVKILPDDFWMSKVPAVLLQSDILVVVTLSVTLSLLATIYPSWRASKMKPVEALRYE